MAFHINQFLKNLINAPINLYPSSEIASEVKKFFTQKKGCNNRNFTLINSKYERIKKLVENKQIDFFDNSINLKEYDLLRKKFSWNDNKIFSY